MRRTGTIYAANRLANLGQHRHPSLAGIISSLVLRRHRYQPRDTRNKQDLFSLEVLLQLTVVGGKVHFGRRGREGDGQAEPGAHEGAGEVVGAGGVRAEDAVELVYTDRRWEGVENKNPRPRVLGSQGMIGREGAYCRSCEWKIAKARSLHEIPHIPAYCQHENS